MMKTHTTYQYLSLLALIIAFLTSCEDVVQVELEETDLDLIAVEAYINANGSPEMMVKLERSLPVDRAESNPPINNALVEIKDDSDTPNSITLTEQGNSGIYLAPGNTGFEVLPGRTYSLTVTTPEGVVITGQEYIQPVETLDTVKMNLSARGNFEFMAVYISSQETPGEGHFYKWDIYKNGELINESENLSFASDELVDGNYIYDFEIFTDFIAPDEGDEEKQFQIGDTIVVQQLSISQLAYEFYFGMINQAFSGGPFSVPPANLKGNLTASDGKRVMGIFSARDVSIGNTIVLDSSNYVPFMPGG